MHPVSAAYADPEWPDLPLRDELPAVAFFGAIGDVPPEGVVELRERCVRAEADDEVAARRVKWNCRVAKITSTIVNCNKSGSYDDVVFIPNSKVVAGAKPVEGDEVVFEATIESGYRANQ